MASDSVERERTWLVRSLPDPLPAGTPVEEGDLVADGEVRLRVRRCGDDHVATVRSAGTGSGTEVEWELTSEQFRALWPLTDRHRLEVVRHEVPLGPLVAQVEVFGVALEGLVLVRVGFEEDAAAQGFTPPDWFGDEVSGDARYDTSARACHGAPGGGCGDPPGRA